MNHIQAEDELTDKAIPELKDPVKGPAIQKRAVEMLNQLGFDQAELNDLAAGKSKMSIHDHRFKQLIKASLDLADLQAKVDSAKKAALKPAPKPVPPVVRPGVTQPAGAVVSQRVQALDSKLSTSGKLEDALALIKARRNVSR